MHARMGNYLAYLNTRGVYIQDPYLCTHIAQHPELNSVVQWGILDQIRSVRLHQAHPIHHDRGFHLIPAGRLVGGNESVNGS